MTAPEGVDPREWHYREFYQVGGAGESRDDPVLVVLGNCQAEAMRILLDSVGRWRTIRIPPVHEFTARDVRLLDEILPTLTHLVAQPIRADYRDLPLGTEQVLRRAPHVRVARFPSLRDSALYPFQAIVRCPPLGDPPLVPYHDLRVLACAAAGESLPARWPAPAAAALRANRDRSRAELRRRQELHSTVDGAAEFDAAGAEGAHVINHPGNPVLVGVAQRLIDAFDRSGELPGPVDGVGLPAAPDRELLGRLAAPLSEAVIEALDLDAQPRTSWLVDGAEVDPREIDAVQLQWYRDHPEVVDAGLQRHRDTMTLLGIG